MTTKTFTCNTCYDRRWVYKGWAIVVGYYPCKDCQPPTPPRPDWLTPMGYDERIQGDGEGGLELVEG